MARWQDSFAPDKIADSIRDNLVRYLIGGVGIVILAVVDDPTIRNVALAVVGVGLVLGAVWGGRLPGARNPDARHATLTQVIDEGRELRMTLPDMGHPGYPGEDNEAFTQWQGRVMGWSERVERKLQEMAPDRQNGYRLPIYLNRAEPYPGTPETVRNLLIELDTRIERLLVIRETLSREGPRSLE